MHARSDGGGEWQDDDQQQHQRQDHEWPRPLLPELGIDFGDDGKESDPDRHSDKLSDEQVGVSVAGLHLHDRAGAVDRRQAESQQHAGQYDQRARLRAHLPSV